MFTPLTRPYLVDTFGKNWVKRSPVDLIKLAYYGTLEFPEQQVVILSTILVHDINTGSQQKDTTSRVGEVASVCDCFLSYGC